MLSHEATDFFIASTHEQYYKRFAKYFGMVIKGVFTDEPGIGYCNGDSAIPYYDGLAEDYKALCGNDLYEDIKTDDKNFCETALSLVYDRFNECFADKINNWHKNHSIEMCGHLMGDDIPTGATYSSGNILKILSSLSTTGIDEITTNLEAKHLFALLGPAEYAKKDTFSPAELFALGPCDMTYTQKRCMIFLSACFKINRYFLAISHLDMRGNTKILDYFNDFSIFQPDFRGIRLLSEDAKLAAEYADKDFTPDVYVQYPTEIYTRQFFNKKCDIDNVFIELLNKL